jgi:hypothetical protein
MERPKYGEIACQHVGKEPGKICKNNSYWFIPGEPERYLCGVHSRGKLLAERQELEKPTVAQKNELRAERVAAERADIERARAENVEYGLRGNVVLTRLLMMRAPERLRGHLIVFPNRKAAVYGGESLHLPQLSPMNLGPVEHGQPDLPPAQNIENFHQGSKVFAEEAENGEPTQLFHENRLAFYLDPVPHRHKYKGKEKNKNIPLYFAWVDKSGILHKLSYVESRQFYCTFYERLVTSTDNYTELRRMIDEGTNVQLCGYDAHPIVSQNGESLADAITRAYLDASVPFGHERVLYAMLMLQPEEYSWRHHKKFDF